MAGKLIGFLFGQRLTLILLIVLSVIASVFFITKIRVDNDTFKAVPSDIKPRIDYENLKRFFPAPYNILFLAEFTEGTLTEKIDSVRIWSKKFGALPGIASVTDLTNLRVPVKRGFLGISGDLIIPADSLYFDEEKVRESIRQNRSFTKPFISEDEKLLGMIMGFEWSADRTAIFDKLLDMVQKINSTGKVRAYFTSEAAVSYFIDKSMRRDLRILLPVCFGVIFALLYIVFQNLLHVFASLCAVTVAIIWTFGIFGMFGFSFSITTSIIPVIVFPIGVADAIHLLRSFTIEKRMCKDNLSSLTRSWQHLLKPCLLTSITTFAGFASFGFSSISWCRTFGLFTGIAVMLCYVCNIVLLPLFISFEKSHIRHQSAAAAPKAEWHDRFWKFFLNLTTRSKIWTAFLPFITAILIIGSVKGRVENNFMMMLPVDNILRRSDAFITRHFGGSRFFSVVLEKRSGTITDINDWKKIDTFTAFITSQKGVGNTASLIPLINRISEMVSKSSISTAAVSLVTSSGEIFGKSYTRLINDFLSSDKRRCRIQVICSNDPDVRILDLTVKIKKYADSRLSDYNVLISGPAVLSESMSAELVNTLFVSLITAFIPVFFSLVIYFRSLRIAIFCTLPIVLLTAMVYAMMGLCNIPINLITVVIMNACIGIGIDYAIHFISGYINEKQKGINDIEALSFAVHTKGTPILFNTLVVGIGFCALLFSGFPPVRHFGFIVFLSMFIAAALCMFIITLLIKNLGLSVRALEKECG